MEELFSSDDLDATQEYLSGAFGRMRLSSSSAHPRTRITAGSLGQASVARVEFGFNMDYTVEPTGLITIGSLDSGVMPQHLTRAGAQSCGPGDVVVFTQPDEACAGRHSHLRYDLVSVEPSLLTRVAATAPNRGATSVRLLGSRPVSAAAAGNLRHTIMFLRDHVLTPADVRQAPLITASAAQLLAAAVLATFPNNALTDPTAADRRDASPAALRRAIAFIDANAHRDIAAADVAAAAHVTIRALQYAFARHHDTTPTGYLRLVRLARAHRDLVNAEPGGADTVTTIATRWGFTHLGRFAALHRDIYGRTPREALYRR